MSKRIYKYTITDEQLSKVLDTEEANHDNVITMTMPDNAQILELRTIGMKPRIFALIDTEAKEIERTFEVYPTGVDIPVADEEDGFTYVGAFTRNGKTFNVLESK